MYTSTYKQEGVIMKTVKLSYNLWKAIKQVALNEDKSIGEIIKISFEHTFGDKK